MLQTTLDPAVIGSHPHNPRREVGDVTDLAASLTAVGLLEPLVVAPWPEVGGPVILLAWLVWLLDLIARAALIAGLLGLLWVLVLMVAPVIADRGESRG